MNPQEPYRDPPLQALELAAHTAGLNTNDYHYLANLHQANIYLQNTTENNQKLTHIETTLKNAGYKTQKSNHPDNEIAALAVTDPPKENQ